MPDEKDLPYLEMLYKFVFGKNSYYDLASTRHVEPQAKIDRMSEEEEPTDRHDMRENELGAIKDGRGTEDCTEGSHGEPHVPQYVRKKKHWQVSPYTRVRVKHRIRRWDGYLYVIHI